MRLSYAAARDLNERALARFEGSWGPESPGVLTVKNNLAAILLAQGDLSGAHALQEDVLSTRERILGMEHPKTLTSKNNLAQTLFARGDLSGAQALQEDVLSARERVLGAEHPDTLISKNNLAATLLAQGELSDAQALQEDVLSARKRVLGAEHPDTLISNGNLAATLFAQGDLANARTLQEWVLLAHDRILGPEHPATLTSKDNLAQTLSAQGDLSGARALQESVLSAHQRVLDSDNPDTLTSKDNLASTLLAQGDLSGAQALQEDVLSALERVLGAEHPDTLTSKDNLAATLFSQGDLSGARALQESVLSTLERVLGAGHPDTLMARNNLGASLYSLGELTAAREQLESVLAATRRVFGGDREPETELEVNAVSWLTSVYRDLGEPELAARTSLEALDAIERQTRRSGDAEELRSSFRQHYDVVYRLSIETLFALERTDDAFRVLQRYRTQSLLQRLERRHIESSEISKDLATQRRMLARHYDRTTHAIYTATSEDDRQALGQKLKRLRRKQQKVEAAIRASIPGGDPTMELADLEAVRAALGPGTLLISYLVGSEETVVFTLTHDGPLEIHREKVDRIELKRQISRFYGQLGSSPQAFQDAGSVNRWLADRLITPIAKRIEAVNRLVIVPDSVLHYLPFAALIRPSADGTSQFLIEQKPIHLAASATIYGRMQRSRPRRGPPGDPSQDAQHLLLAAFGDPSYPKSLARRHSASQLSAGEPSAGTATRLVLGAIERNLISGLVPLPQSGREVRAIERLYATDGEAIAYTGADASEANLKRDAPRARVVHIAAHGLADPDRPFDSFLALTLREQLANDATENGLLQAWELFDGNLRLDADLVVLSACQTALGENRGGEGIISLARAFHVAGARTVAASLWTVADESTAELMIRFHRYLRQGLTKDVALQQAQIDFIRGRARPDGEEIKRKFAAPFHWAAFQLFGNWK